PLLNPRSCATKPPDSSARWWKPGGHVKVPKAFGGTYWDGDEQDFRDVKIGYDPNDLIKKEVVRDFLERLLRGGMLSDEATKISDDAAIVNAFINERNNSNPAGYGCLNGA